jgi:hypothetical protein
MREFPLHVVVYAAAVGALSRKNYGALKAVAVEPVVRNNGRRESVLHHLAPYDYVTPYKVAASVLASECEGKEVTDEQVRTMLERGGLRFTPISDALHALIRPLVAEQVPDDIDYSDLFDEVEVLLGALAEDSHHQARATEDRWLNRGWFGRFTWRDRHTTTPVHRRLEAELKAAGSSWPPLEAGLFGGSYERATVAFQSFNDQADKVMNQRW